ncbi:MAG: DUF2161 family putative PD-(D/E)XK-type phosphodiesterase [Leptospiraceae bacterium]|nr:DUF2161 family putative PD-(D/E)XK-type phosphodiesterase [Leptospiraceae bacterium]
MRSFSMRETGLYPAVAEYFTAQGFVVKGEVLGCDLVAVRGEEIAIAELKNNFSTRLLYQAVRRLAITPHVYAAIPKPTRQKPAHWQMMKSLVRRLQLGLLLIQGTEVRCLVEPAEFHARLNTRLRRRLLAEFHGRHIAQNTGGSRGRKLETAYLEAAIHVAALLSRFGPTSPRQLVAQGAPARCQRILYDNYYAWFEKVARGQYRLCRGMQAEIARRYPQIWDYYQKQCDGR